MELNGTIRRQEHTALFEKQQHAIQKEYDLLQDRIEHMNQIFADNYRQNSKLVADLFESTVVGKANIEGCASEVRKDLV